MAGMKKKLIPLCLIAAMACVFALAGCGNSDSDGLTGGVAATVNGTEIAEDDVTEYIQTIRESNSLTEDADWAEYLNSIGYTPETLRDAVIDYFVTQKLEEQAAADEGVEISDSDIDESLDSMRSNYDSDEAWQEALSSAGYTEDSYRESIRQSMLEEKLEEAVVSEDDAKADDETVLSYVQAYAPSLDGMKRSSHILFASDDEDTAKQVLEQINAGADFAELAKEYSTDTGSAENGGDVGWDKLNSFVTAYSDALDELDEGETSDLVTSDYGIHIIRCTDVWNAPDTISSLDDVPEELVETIRTQIADPAAKQSAFNSYIEDLRDKADIQKSDMPSGVAYNVNMDDYISSNSSDVAESDDATDATDESAEDSSADDSESSDSAAAEDATDESDAAESDAAESSSASE